MDVPGGRPQHLRGRVAVVTGAGRGIGRAHALRLGSHGAAVVVNDLGSTVVGGGADAAPAVHVVDEILAAGGQAVSDNHDVATFGGGACIVAGAIERFGRLDIVVNNAGIVTDEGLEEVTEEGLLRLLGVHYLGTIGVCRAALPHLKRQGYGRIVTTTSEAALDNRFPGGIGYGGAKAAVWAASLAMARQLDGTGITVNCISPGARTRMNDALFEEHPPTLDLDPDHVAAVVAALVAEDAGDLSGLVIHAAGGAVREYRVGRWADTPAVSRISEAVRQLG